jgi:Cys-rich four helix bundle protein (predicted Tat secretion target)
MQRREFITAAVGTVAAAVSAAQAFGANGQLPYPDFLAIKKIPSGGEAGAAKKGMQGGAVTEEKGIIEKLTEAVTGGGLEEIHPPKYKSLEDTAAKCVVTGNDCLRHCYGMFKMNDTSMAACADAAYQLVAACAALNALAAVNSEHTGHLGKTVEMICNDCKAECDKFPKIKACKDCGDACKDCAEECRRIAA